MVIAAVIVQQPRRAPIAASIIAQHILYLVHWSFREKSQVGKNYL